MFILISVIVIMIWVQQNLEKVLSNTAQNTSHHIPDYTMENFKTTQMDKYGQLKNQLTAKTMTHYPDKNAKLNAPSVIFYKQKRPIWTVQAEEGEISLDGRQVWLVGNTTLQRLTFEQKKLIEVFSQNMWVRLDTEYAETKASTSILMDNGKTVSQGMRVFMPTERVELLSKVRGDYVFP